MRRSPSTSRWIWTRPARSRAGVHLFAERVLDVRQARRGQRQHPDAPPLPADRRRRELRLPLARTGLDPDLLMHDVRLVRERLDDLREAMRRREALDALAPQLDRCE